MATKNSDLRAEILTNGLGSQMLDTVSPIYNNSKVTLNLFQSIGITLEKIKDFMALELTNNFPPDSQLLMSYDLVNDDPELQKMESFAFQCDNNKFARVIVIDNIAGMVCFDDCLKASELEDGTWYKADCTYSLRYKCDKGTYRSFMEFRIISNYGSATDLTINVYMVDMRTDASDCLHNRMLMDYNYISQIFIQTATWGLKYWEDEYGVTPDPSWNYEQRRQNLLTKLQYTAPITPRKIADRISSLTGIPADVNEVAGTNALEVILHELKLDHLDVYKTVDRITPAHLIYTIKTEEEENSALTSYYKIMVSEAENVAVIVKYTILTDENDYILTNELDEVLTV